MQGLTNLADAAQGEQSIFGMLLPFVLILLILFFMPRGLFGARVTDRV